MAAHRLRRRPLRPPIAKHPLRRRPTLPETAAHRHPCQPPCLPTAAHRAPHRPPHPPRAARRRRRGPRRPVRPDSGSRPLRNPCGWQHPARVRSPYRIPPPQASKPSKLTLTRHTTKDDRFPRMAGTLPRPWISSMDVEGVLGRGPSRESLESRGNIARSSAIASTEGVRWFRLWTVCKPVLERSERRSTKVRGRVPSIRPTTVSMTRATRRCAPGAPCLRLPSRRRSSSCKRDDATF